MLQRFEREARAISRLSHPHICALYDVGREGATEYLVMEYLKGETLSSRLARGALPLEQTLRFGIEIADALNAAHRQGIVHRDLKPGNVMLTKSGAKLLDFGLAKAAANPGAADLSALATAEKSLTAAGAVVGTVQYMAPEQLGGQEADARTDIFAFGAVLYEMATGRKAFSGETQPSVMTAILRDDPESIAAQAPKTPPALERLIRTCLAKEPDDRWQSAGDAARELRWIAEGPPASAAVPPAANRSPIRERIAWSGAVALALALAAVAALSSRRPQAGDELIRFKIAPPPGQTFFGETALSPDGRRILFLLQDDAGRDSVALRSMDSVEMKRLPGTEDARGMFWSPDGREIGFFSEGRLKRMSAEGGPVQAVCESGSSFSGAWGPDGTILFTKIFNGPIFAVPASGGTPRPATSVDKTKGEFGHFHPSFLPDGRHFLFVAGNLDPEKTWVELASLDSKEVHPLFTADSQAVFADGYLLYGRDGALFARKFDPGRLKITGDPIPAFENVRVLRDDAMMDASAVGKRIVFVTWLGRRRLAWVDRKGRELGNLGDIGCYSDVRISPDGLKVAVTRHDPSHGLNQDVWVVDVSRGTASPIASGPIEEFGPAWFPDGERLVYVASSEGGPYDVFERKVTGGSEKVLLHSNDDKILPSVSPDGSQLLYSVSRGSTFSRSMFSLVRPSQPISLTGASLFSEQHPAFSPDGRWCAFDSNDSGAREVYIQAIPDGPRHQLSIRGGQMPVWNRDGSEIFYAARDGMLMSVKLRISGGRLESEEPQILFLLGLGTTGELPWHRHPFDVSPDGQRFLVIRPAADAEPPGAVVVTNWTNVLGAK
jgi:Tol biopolymer transport system component